MTQIERIKNKIVPNNQLEERIAAWRKENAKIVFTNGCFDLLHLGHADYLAKAKDLGDRLIIGVNTDSSVKRLKGANRPLQDEYSRLFLLASFEAVDAVVLFEEDTPYQLISRIQPDVLVKGADYKPESIVGYDIVSARGGRVETIEFVEGYSTSSIEQRIIKNAKQSL